jgi:hypothetical protein
MRYCSTAIATCMILAALGRNALAEDFSARGLVVLGNIQATLQFQGAVSPYVGKAISPQVGFNLQTGAILPDPGSIVPIDGGGIQFEGVQGPNSLAGGRELHVLTARGGKIFCEWKATFTLTPTADGQKVILTGDGDFTVVGGTGKYRGATGRFKTLFTTVPTLPTADTTLATFTQEGTIHFGRKR